MNKKVHIFDTITQFALPIFTILGFLLTALKMPGIGLTINLIGQVFWFYASWKAWREAGQIGIFITTIVIFIILVFGVINYAFFE